VTADERLKNSTLQEPKNTYVSWKKKDKKWYESIYVGDGVSQYSTKDREESLSEESLRGRILRAWHVLR
jgi:hypothetical protein